MKKIKSLIYSAGLLALLGACSNNDLVEQPIPSDGALSFRSNIESVATRVVDNSWEANDAIGVYSLLTADQTTFGGFENVEYVTTAAGATVEFNHATANTGVVLDGKTEVDIFAYYPYKSDIVGFDYPIDVTHPTKLTDLLYSSNVKAVKDTAKPELFFKHTLSKFTLVLSIDGAVGNLITSLEGLVADQIKGTKTKANFNIKTGLIEGLSNAAAIKPIYSINEAKNVVTITAYMIPGQALTAVEAPLSLKGKTFTWKSTITKSLEAGKSYTMKAGLREIEEGKVVLVNFNGSIQDWEVGHDDGTTETVDPEKDATKLEVSVQNLEVEAVAGQTAIAVTASEGLVWDVKVDEVATWLTAVKSATGIDLTVEENTTTEARTANLTFSAEGVDNVVVSVSQKGKTEDPQEATVIFEDSFLSESKKQSVTEYFDIFKTSGVLLQHPNLNYVGSENLSVRSSGDYSVWFPFAADKHFEIQNIKVSGYSDLTLSFMVQGQTADLVPTSAMSVKIGDRVLDALPEGNFGSSYTEYTLQLGVVETEEITISFDVTDQPNNGGLRLDNIAVKGNK